MKSHSIADSVNSTSLFPAYSRESEVQMKDDSDWLCNSSFRPSNLQDIFSTQGELSNQEKCLEETEDRRKTKHSKKRKKEHSKKQSILPTDTHHVQENDSIRSQLSKKTFIEETGLSYERAYRVDPKCDRENFYYESLGQNKTANYRIHTKFPFGCTEQEKNLYPQPLPNKLKSNISRYFSKKSLKLLTKSTCEEEICLSKEPLSSGATLDYIPLSLSSKYSDSIQEGSKANFDGISTSWKLSSVKNENSEVIEIPDETFDFELRNKTKRFNKEVTESPHDIQLWMDFVEFQEELYQSNAEGSSESFLIEKKVSILDKALKHNPKSVQLNIAKLNLCRSIWKIEKVIECWDNLIFLNPNNPLVWQEYVTFVLTDLTYFSVPRMLKVFSKCLRTLSNLSEGIIQSHVPPPDIIYNMLDIFNQLCFILISCGYTERAVALFQALIEFNLFADSTTESLSVSEKIACFEPFWDSGAARFGEDGAIGWSVTISEKKISFEKTVFQSDLSNIEDDILYKKLPEWKTWMEFERLREVHHWLPWKPNPDYDQTDDDIDDIDRTVPFDDVSKFLFAIFEEEHQFLLVQNFVKFLGFNPHEFGCTISTESTANTHITICNFDIISKTINDTLFNAQVSNPLCFKTNNWTKDRINFVKNVFSQTLGKFSLRYKVLLSLVWLKFLQDIALNCKDMGENMDWVKKFTKNMLKENENRNCLLLWYEYIKIEFLSGSNTKAKKTFETLLTSSSLAVAGGSISMKELWYFARSYINLCLGFQGSWTYNSKLSSRNEIIWLLIHIGCGDKYVPYSNELIKPTLILKAVSGFKSLLNRELNSLTNTCSKLCYCLDPCGYSFMDCAKCFAYLQYFTQGLDSANQVLKDTSEILKDKLIGSLKRNIMEQICIFQAELLNFHTRNTTVSMKPLLIYLYASIKQYPDSTRLLHILVKWRSASSVVSPTRRFFAKILKEHYKIQPITWIFAIASELTIAYLISDQNELNIETDLPCLGLKWKIRALYERALNSSLCGYIPVLWRSYLKFEMLNNEVEKAKSVFHRAMQNCGWSKELLMDGIECFPDDLKQTIDFMVEKQIRIHTPLEEITLLMDHGIQSLEETTEFNI